MSSKNEVPKEHVLFEEEVIIPKKLQNLATNKKT
jgi:hypothetical protein